eukprot:8755189-Pyramimonas_sp.AAC.1
MPKCPVHCGPSAHSGHARRSAQVQPPDIATVGARNSLQCPSSIQTHDVYVATDVQQDGQHHINHGPAVRC